MLKHLAASSLLLSIISLLSFPQRAASTTVDNGSIDWAYGRIVDSITVSGNKKTKSFVILREMETRPGDVLSKDIFERDTRYLTDLGLFASIETSADSLDFGHCALRIHVIERPVFFLKTIVPIINYDWDDKGFEFGIKWDDRNFRGSGEHLHASYKRDAASNNNVSFGWSAPWVGWRHIGLGLNFFYFNRADTLESSSVLQRYGAVTSVAYPLTSSRISLAQVIGRVSLDDRRIGIWGKDEDDRLYISPLIGLRLDSRDSPLKPTRGRSFTISVLATRSLSGEKQLYYGLTNDLRFFRPFSKRLVLGLHSNLWYQFGEFPDFAKVRIGGPGTIRGYSDGKFSGYHRWFQSMEWRYAVLRTKVFRLPVIGYIDVGLHAVVFIDSGIVWEHEEEFQAKRFHSGAGVGLRLYSPYQDVVRFDLGFNRWGDLYPIVRTGINF